MFMSRHGFPAHPLLSILENSESEMSKRCHPHIPFGDQLFA